MTLSVLATVPFHKKWYMRTRPNYDKNTREKVNPVIQLWISNRIMIFSPEVDHSSSRFKCGSNEVELIGCSPSYNGAKTGFVCNRDFVSHWPPCALLIRHETRANNFSSIVNYTSIFIRSACKHIPLVTNCVHINGFAHNWPKAAHNDCFALNFRPRKLDGRRLFLGFGTVPLPVYLFENYHVKRNGTFPRENVSHI